MRVLFPKIYVRYHIRQPLLTRGPDMQLVLYTVCDTMLSRARWLWQTSWCDYLQISCNVCDDFEGTVGPAAIVIC